MRLPQIRVTNRIWVVCISIIIILNALHSCSYWSPLLIIIKFITIIRSFDFFPCIYLGWFFYIHLVIPRLLVWNLLLYFTCWIWFNSCKLLHITISTSINIGFIKELLNNWAAVQRLILGWECNLSFIQIWVLFNIDVLHIVFPTRLVLFIRLKLVCRFRTRLAQLILVFVYIWWLVWVISCCRNLSFISLVTSIRLISLKCLRFFIVVFVIGCVHSRFSSCGWWKLSYIFCSWTIFVSNLIDQRSVASLIRFLTLMSMFGSLR